MGMGSAAPPAGSPQEGIAPRVVRHCFKRIGGVGWHCASSQTGPCTDLEPFADVTWLPATRGLCFSLCMCVSTRAEYVLLFGMQPSVHPVQKLPGA